MKQQQEYMTKGISEIIATTSEFGSVVDICKQAHNDGIWDYFNEEVGVSSTLCDDDIKENENAMTFKKNDFLKACEEMGITQRLKNG